MLIFIKATRATQCGIEATEKITLNLAQMVAYKEASPEVKLRYPNANTSVFLGHDIECTITETVEQIDNFINKVVPAAALKSRQQALVDAAFGGLL